MTRLSQEPTLEGPPHPLVAALADVVAPGKRVLVVGFGSGRHLPHLLERGLFIDVIEEDPQRADAAIAGFDQHPRVRIARARYDHPLPFDATYDGAVTTHVLLHGTPRTIASALAMVARQIRAYAPFHLTLGSQRDPRFRTGTSLDAQTRVAESGSEAGIPHAYFDAGGARALLSSWKILSLEEHDAAQTAGRWAHAPNELETMVHWFARITRRRSDH